MPAQVARSFEPVHYTFPLIGTCCISTPIIKICYATFLSQLQGSNGTELICLGVLLHLGFPEDEHFLKKKTLLATEMERLFFMSLLVGEHTGSTTD